MTKRSNTSRSWPALMRAETAAQYVDEVSVQAFRRGVGKVYPPPILVPHKGERWRRKTLDDILDRLEGNAVHDVADLI